MALLGDYTDKEDTSIRIGAIMGLGIAYAGSQNEQVIYISLYFWKSCNNFCWELRYTLYANAKFLICSCFFQLREKLTGVLNDSKASLDVLAFTAISLGLIFVGSCNEEIAQAIIYTLMDRSESELGEPLTRLLPLGLGLLYLGKQVISCLPVCCLYFLN